MLLSSSAKMQTKEPVRLDRSSRIVDRNSNPICAANIAPGRTKPDLVVDHLLPLGARKKHKRRQRFHQWRKRLGLLCLALGGGGGNGGGAGSLSLLSSVIFDYTRNIVNKNDQRKISASARTTARTASSMRSTRRSFSDEDDNFNFVELAGLEDDLPPEVESVEGGARSSSSRATSRSFSGGIVFARAMWFGRSSPRAATAKATAEAGVSTASNHSTGEEQLHDLQQTSSSASAPGDQTVPTSGGQAQMRAAPAQHPRGARKTDDGTTSTTPEFGGAPPGGAGGASSASNGVNQKLDVGCSRREAAASSSKVLVVNGVEKSPLRGTGVGMASASSTAGAGKIPIDPLDWSSTTLGPNESTRALTASSNSLCNSGISGTAANSCSASYLQTDQREGGSCSSHNGRSVNSGGGGPLRLHHHPNGSGGLLSGSCGDELSSRGTTAGVDPVLSRSSGASPRSRRGDQQQQARELQLESGLVGHHIHQQLLQGQGAAGEQASPLRLTRQQSGQSQATCVDSLIDTLHRSPLEIVAGGGGGQQDYTPGGEHAGDQTASRTSGVPTRGGSRDLSSAIENMHLDDDHRDPRRRQAATGGASTSSAGGAPGFLADAGSSLAAQQSRHHAAQVQHSAPQDLGDRGGGTATGGTTTTSNAHGGENSDSLVTPLVLSSAASENRPAAGPRRLSFWARVCRRNSIDEDGGPVNNNPRQDSVSSNVSSVLGTNDHQQAFFSRYYFEMPCDPLGHLHPVLIPRLAALEEHTAQLPRPPSEASSIGTGAIMMNQGQHLLRDHHNPHHRGGNNSSSILSGIVGASPHDNDSQTSGQSTHRVNSFSSGVGNVVATTTMLAREQLNRLRMSRADWEVRNEMVQFHRHLVSKLTEITVCDRRDQRNYFHPHVNPPQWQPTTWSHAVHHGAAASSGGPTAGGAVTASSSGCSVTPGGSSFLHQSGGGTAGGGSGVFLQHQHSGASTVGSSAVSRVVDNQYPDRYGWEPPPSCFYTTAAGGGQQQQNQHLFHPTRGSTTGSTSSYTGGGMVHQPHGTTPGGAGGGRTTTNASSRHDMQRSGTASANFPWVLSGSASHDRLPTMT
ncbi:unnamed protein product [Amoebophrya sp. A120]|nr:unnamed protein product [Amoebophrya sp. A120]|eukprot:GSA120T00007334001.1